MAKSKITKQQEEEVLRKHPINNFTCCGKTMNFKEFKKHLMEVHKLDTSGLKGKQTMTSHMDGDFWFSSSYNWELENGLKFTQYVEMTRSKSSPMRG